MSLAKKLQLPAGEKVCILEAPPGVELDLPITNDTKSGAILLFARDERVLQAKGEPVIRAAREDRLAWIAYPKAGQRGTDLNRDLLWKKLQMKGIRAVRQVSIDDVWSALRFRPE